MCYVSTVSMVILLRPPLYFFFFALLSPTFFFSFFQEAVQWCITATYWQGAAVQIQQFTFVSKFMLRKIIRAFQLTCEECIYSVEVPD